MDTHSNLFAADKLSNTTADCVIDCLKAHFARHDIPKLLVTDNGPQFTARVFSTFRKEWNFQHETSSPGNSQANGAAEAAVKIVKRLWRKCLASGEDMLLGLLNLRNIPNECLDTSPSQRLFGRRTRSLLPAKNCQLTPRHHSSDSDALKKHNNRLQKCNYDTGRELMPLTKGNTVRIEPSTPSNRKWQEATVARRLSGRAYEVETEDGRKYRRNRRHLKQSTPSIHSIPSTPSSPSFRCNTHANVKIQNSEPSGGQPATDNANYPPAKAPGPSTEVPDHTNNDGEHQPSVSGGQPQQPREEDPVCCTRAGHIVKPPARYRDN